MINIIKKIKKLGKKKLAAYTMIFFCVISFFTYVFMGSKIPGMFIAVIAILHIFLLASILISKIAKKN